MAKKERAPFKEIFGWAMFDFANSSYTTVIITVVFSVLFPRVIVGDGPDFKMGNWYWTVALSISYFLIAFAAPVLGAIMDFSASKKKFLMASYLLTVVATAALYFVTPGAIVVGIILVVISNFGFSAGESFVSSFLPELGPQEELGKISGFAWGLGYFGGIASTGLVLALLGSQTVENFELQRFVGPITGLFFLVAGIPTFLLLKERGVARKLSPGQSYWSVGFGRLKETFADLKSFRDLMVFLISLFFSFAGLSIVISFAFIYGDQVIGWQDSTKALMFVITNLTAAVGAVIFGYIQDKIGDKLTYNITLIIWIIAVTLIYAAAEVTGWINASLGTEYKTEFIFLFIGSIAGLSLGATQSAGRAMVGVFSPESKSGEFFGLWGLAGKAAAILGLMSLGAMQLYFGLKTAILLTSGFFVLAFLTALLVNEKRGKEAARAHEGA